MNTLILADGFIGPQVSAAPPWIVFLAMTIVVELSVVAIAWRFSGRYGALKRWFLAGLIGNAVSHPIATFVWFGLPRFNRWELMAAYAMIEVILTIFEAWVYQRIVRCPAPLALLFSALANGFTGAFGAYLVFAR